MTTTIQHPQPLNEQKQSRIIGAIITDVKDVISANGNAYKSFTVVADNGTPGGAVYFSMKVMQPLFDKLPSELFQKFRYAKWTGMVTEKPYVSKKDGQTKIGRDMLVNGVELQTGEYVSGKKDKADEDS